MTIEETIKELSNKAYEKTITGFQTRFPELKEQLREAYYRENINIYQKLKGCSERSNFIKYLEKKAN